MESRHSALIYLYLNLRHFQHLLWESCLGGRTVIQEVSKCGLLASLEGEILALFCLFAKLPSNEDNLSRVRSLVFCPQI